MSAAAVPSHPRVPVWLRPLTRRRGEVQFGVQPGGPVVTGISDTEARLLGRLDGGLPLASTERLAADAGITPARWHALLELAAGLGVLSDRSIPVSGGSGTGPGRVVVDGCGDVATRIAESLAGAGLTVAHGRAAVDRAVAAPGDPRPDLVVLLGSPVVDHRRGDVWLRHGVPHLPVAPATPRTTIGPLVDCSPGAPCLWCLDRHRADRDQSWPVVMSQAAPARAEVVPVTPEGAHDPLPPGLSHLVVGSVALFVTGLLEGRRPPAGVSVEVSLPWPRMDHRRWPVHPLCPGHPSAAAQVRTLPATHLATDAHAPETLGREAPAPGLREPGPPGDDALAQGA